jgi:REP element-mobilizing transposase RayT
LTVNTNPPPSQPRGDRRSIRLKGYDYSQPGAYFVTIVAQEREGLFGDIHAEEMDLSEVGQLVADTWEWLGRQYPHVELDTWVVMPNHLHGIILITDISSSTPNRRGGSRAAPTKPAVSTRKPLGQLVGAFKTVSTKRVNRLHNTPGTRLWQRNYYERVIRNEAELEDIQAYIVNNPAGWDEDAENPANAGHSERHLV